MMRYPNLPSQQWFTQRLVDGFNQDEAQWRRALLERLKRALRSLQSNRKRRKRTMGAQTKLMSILADED